MLHLLSFKFKNWQGSVLFSQSLSPPFSFFNHCSWNSPTVCPKCADILFISCLVKVGVMVLQQLAQERQSVSCHTSFSSCRIFFSSPRDGPFSSFVRNLRKLLFFSLACFRNERRLMGCISIMRRRYYLNGFTVYYKRIFPLQFALVIFVRLSNQQI